jgi:hypothetical protein
VQRNDQVWSEGMSDWMTAGQVPELRDRFPAVGVKASVKDPAGHQTASAASSGHTQTAPMAVASLVLGLLGTNLLFFLGSILAVIFGHIALGQIKESGGRLGGHGLAIAGLVFGYAVIVIAVVVGIFLFSILLLGAFAAPEL